MEVYGLFQIRYPAIKPNGEVNATTITYKMAIILALSFGSTSITCIESSIGLMRDTSGL